MFIYLDESGDLGYNFANPYRNGGSSRYMTIAYMLIPGDKIHLPFRKVRNIYTKYRISPKKEKKGSDLGDEQRALFCGSVVNLLGEHPDIKIGAITVQKQNVFPEMRVDQNILYNFMIKLAVLQRIAHEEIVFLVPDKKPIKIKDLNKCQEYLQQEFLKIGSKTRLEYHAQDSKEDPNLIFIDWVCNSVWKHYEDKASSGYNILQPALIDDAPLFFR